MDPKTFEQFSQSLISKVPIKAEPMDLKTLFSTIGAAASTSKKIQDAQPEPTPQLPPAGATPVGMAQPSPAMGAALPPGAAGGGMPPQGAANPIMARLMAAMGR